MSVTLLESHHPQMNDIGAVDVSKLNNDEKCSLLNKHFVPHEGYKFPVATDSQGKRDSTLVF